MEDEISNEKKTILLQNTIFDKIKHIFLYKMTNNETEGCSLNLRLVGQFLQLIVAKTRNRIITLKFEPCI